MKLQKKTRSQMYAYCDRLQVGTRGQVTKDHALELPPVQQGSSPGVPQLFQGSPLHDGVELQAAWSKSCCLCQYPSQCQPNTTPDYQNMIRWGSGHASPDVHADGVWVRLNLALSERGESRLEGD